VADVSKGSQRSPVELPETGVLVGVGPTETLDPFIMTGRKTCGATPLVFASLTGLDFGVTVGAKPAASVVDDLPHAAVDTMTTSAARPTTNTWSNELTRTSVSYCAECAWFLLASI
jgi:hypothetical protein